LAQYHHNGLGKEAGNVTDNVVLWPKMFVLSMSRQKFDALSEQQRGWIQEAADLGVKASLEATYDESSIAQELCTRGVRFKDATPAQLLTLRTRFATVLDRLAADPESGPLLTTIKAVAAEYPQSETLRVDSDCRQGASIDSRSAGAVPRTAAAIPDGVYRVQISTEEVLAAGLDNHDGTSGTWTLSVRHGRFELRCQPVAAPGDDCGGSTQSEPLEWGALRGKGNVVYFVSDTTEPLKAVRWAIKSNELQFTNPEHSGSWESGIGMLVLKPWQKIK
jgi:hypothetical protein